MKINTEPPVNCPLPVSIELNWIFFLEKFLNKTKPAFPYLIDNDGRCMKIQTNQPYILTFSSPASNKLNLICFLQRFLSKTSFKVVFKTNQYMLLTSFNWSHWKQKPTQNLYLIFFPTQMFNVDNLSFHLSLCFYESFQN